MAVYPEDGEEPTALIDRADAAMYDVKRGKKAQRERQ
jgi:GGDEF domain-containing protein